MNVTNEQGLARGSSVPLYRQLIEDIKRRIGEGRYGAGDWLGSERALCKQYGVSLITVRQALAQLAQTGWVYRVVGKGTYVAGRDMAEGAATHVPLGVVLPESEHLVDKAFSSDFMFGFGAISSEFEHSMKLYSARDTQYLQDALNRRVQGLVVTGVAIPQWRLLQHAGIPFVLVGDWDEVGVYVVDVDNVEVSRQQTTHLLQSGCCRIGLINAPGGESPFARDRLEGYHQALAECQVPADNALVKVCDFTAESGQAAARELAAQGVDGIVAVDDVVATGVARAVRDQGLRIPADIKVIGCNNTSLAKSYDPPLSSVDLHPARLGRMAGERLIQLLRAENPPRRTLLPGQVVGRESTARTATVVRAYKPVHETI